MKRLLYITIILVAYNSVFGQAQNCIQQFIERDGIKKDTYSVAYFLPLNLDKSISEFKLDKAMFNKFTLAAYSVYQGIMVSLENQSENMPYLDVYIIDAESDSIGLDYWLSRGLKDMDMVLSSLPNKYNDQLVESIRNYKIPFVSITSVSTIDKGYDRYLQMQPTLATHCEYMRHMIDSNYDDYNLIVIKSNGVGTINSLEYFGYDLDTNQIIDIEEDINLEKFTSKLSNEKPNIIIASLINTSLAETFLNAASKIGNKQLVIYGMPTWSEINGLKKYLSTNLTIYFTTGFRKNSQTTGAQFIADFKERYGTSPTSMSFKGYEANQYYVNKLLVTDSAYFMSLHNDPDPKSINNIKINPVCEDGKIHHWENQNVYLIRGEEGTLEFD